MIHSNLRRHPKALHARYVIVACHCGRPCSLENQPAIQPLHLRVDEEI
jgi:hypothetical protein